MSKSDFQNKENISIVDNVMLENNHLLLSVKIKMVTNTKAVCQFPLKNILI